MNSLKSKRKKLGLTQKEVAKATGVSRRTYQKYEEEKINNETYDYLIKKLDEMGYFDGSNYLLNPKIIIKRSTPIFKKYPEIKAVYLIGSYAEDRATGKDDVDLFVVATPPRLTYIELIEILKEVLHKNIDIRLHIDNNQSLLENVLIKGIKIYAKRSHRN